MLFFSFIELNERSREESVLRLIQIYFFLFINENICCDPSLEQFWRDVYFDGSHNMFYGEIWLIIAKLSLLSLLIWSTVKDTFFSLYEKDGLHNHLQ